MDAVSNKSQSDASLGLGQSYLECSCWEHQVLRQGFLCTQVQEQGADTIVRYSVLL